MSATPTDQITRIVWDAVDKRWFVYTGGWIKNCVEGVTIKSDPVRWKELFDITAQMKMRLCGDEQVYTPKRNGKR